jgi:hypothetical protein
MISRRLVSRTVKVRGCSGASRPLAPRIKGRTALERARHYEGSE